jgi:hypothetical protein
MEWLEHDDDDERKETKNPERAKNKKLFRPAQS